MPHRPAGLLQDSNFKDMQSKLKTKLRGADGGDDGGDDAGDFGVPEEI